MDAGERAYRAFTASLASWLGSPVKVLTEQARKPVAWHDLGDEQRKAWADAESAVRRSDR